MRKTNRGGGGRSCVSWGMELWNTGVGLEVSIIVGNAVISYWEMGLGKGDEGETLCFEVNDTVQCQEL